MRSERWFCTVYHGLCWHSDCNCMVPPLMLMQFVNRLSLVAVTARHGSKTVQSTMTADVDDGGHGGSRRVTEQWKWQIRMSGLTVVIGLVLMVYMITIESEPGGIPLLLIVLGVGWYLLTRIRSQSHRE